MFFLNFSFIWGFTFFINIFYLIFITTFLLYFIPIAFNVKYATTYKSSSMCEIINSFEIYWIIVTILFVITFINFTWTSSTLILWFGHLCFLGFNHKITFIIIFFFYLTILINTFSISFSSRDVYDFILTELHFFLWILFIFSSNTLFAIIFFIEILSTLIFLLITVSTFSSTFFYNNLNLNIHSYFAPTLPFIFIQALIFFFWISLLASLILFLFSIFFYMYFLTFDWFLIEFLFYFINTTTFASTWCNLSLIWTFFILALFLKCGVAPFYFWKPTFFKGISFNVLFFYIMFFYFFIFIFFSYLLVVLFNEIFYYFIYINVLFLLIGLTILICVLCESLYLKSFFALSSVLNTVFVFLLISNPSYSGTLFFL